MSKTAKDPQGDPETTKNLLRSQQSNDYDEVKRRFNVMSLTEDTTCGFGCLRGSTLQKFANQTSYVVVYGLVGCVFAATNSYFHGTISTLEKRYKIPTRNTGIIMMGNDISQVLCSAFLGYYAGKKHRPRWMTFGLFTIITFCLLTVAPHLIYGAGEDPISLTNEYGAVADVKASLKDLQEQQQKRLCRNDGTGVECEVSEGILLPQILLFLAQFVAGLFTLIIFCLLTVAPHLIYGAGEDALSLTNEYGAVADVKASLKDLQEQQQKRLCRNDGTGVECEVSEGILLPQILLFLAQFVAGIGGSLYHTLGVAYMDDNTEKAKAPAMLSLSYFFGMLGPSLGYTLASLCLRWYIAPNLTPVIGQTDSRWLGAWWLGWLIMAGLIFVSGIFLFMFPKELPMTQARRLLQAAKEKEANNGLSLEHLETQTSLHDMLRTFKNFFKNKIVVFNLSSNILYFFGYVPYWIFTAKYIEIQYRQSAATSSMVTGTVALVFSAIGILLSGVIISKYKPKARYLAGWNVLVDVVTVCGMFAYAFIGCSANDNSLINNSYESVFHSAKDCNSICVCDYVRYMPVCGEDQMTYISPCHAGCKKEYMDTTGHKIFYDCSCISNNNSSSSNSRLLSPLTLDELNNNTSTTVNGPTLVSGGQAVDGACPVNCSNQFYTFLAVMCVIKLFAATGRASNLLITMRSVAPQDKSAIMGFGMMLISLLCFVPAPVFYGWIFDKNCLVWGKTCTNKGNCWSYDSMNLRLNLNIVAGSFVAVSTFCNMGVWYHVKDLKVFDDDEEKSKEMKRIC